MKPLAILIIVVLAIVSAASVSAWRGSGKAIAVASAEAGTFSNKLAEATASIAEKEGTLQTLRVQLGLKEADCVALTNRILALKAELKSAGEAIQRHATTVKEREGEAAALRGEGEGLRQASAAVEERVKWLEQEIAAAREKAEAAEQQAASLATQLNLSESTRAALLQKWNDPSALRAQAKRLAQPPNSTLAIRGDGKIESSSAPAKTTAK